MCNIIYDGISQMLEEKCEVSLDDAKMEAEDIISFIRIKLLDLEVIQELEENEEIEYAKNREVFHGVVK